MVEIRTGKNGTRFMFEESRGDVLVFIGERLHMTILSDIAPGDDEHFQREIARFMDTWDVANPTQHVTGIR